MRRASFPLFSFLLAVFVGISANLLLAQSEGPGDEPGGGQAPSNAPQSPGNANPPADKAASSAGDAKDFAKEAYVIEQMYNRASYENDGTSRKESTYRVRVQSEAGVQRWGQLRLGYNSANERLDIVYVRVIKQDGSVVKPGPDAVQDLSPIPQNASVYTDYREKHVTVPGLRPGDVLEFQTVNTTHTPLAQGQFWTQHDFNTSSIVLDEQLEIDIPAGRTVELKTRPGMEPKTTEENGRRIYRWSSSHLVIEEDEKKADKDKPKKKKKKEELPAVQLTTFASWEEVGRWYAGLEKDRRQPTKEMKEKADALTKGLTTDLDKIQALYDFVGPNFRYVSLSLGMARYQPHAAVDVLHNQYGDCKDKHTLLAALLEAEGFHASSVLINSFRKLDPDVPSPGQFNHVITMVPLGKEEIWMDTTTEIAPFRLLSYSLRKKQALVIPQEGTPHLEETPADPPVPDSQRSEIEGTVSETGKLEAKVSYIIRGDSELILRSTFRRFPPAQWNKIVEGINKGLGGDVSDVKVSDPAATHQPFTLSYAVSKINYVDWSKKKLELSLPLSRFAPVAVSQDVDAEEDDPDPAASEPFKIGVANEHTYRLKLELAARYTPQIPVPVNIERDYGVYQSTYKVDGNTFIAERRLLTRVDELPPARANDYRAFRRSVLADAAQLLTVESTAADTHTPPESMKTDELIRSGNEARKNGNYTLAINLLQRAVGASPKDKNAWNDLGMAYYDTRQDNLAINAFEKQIEIDPFDQYSYNNLGRVFLRQRKYEEAERWFRKQIEVSPLDRYAHENLDRTLVAWGKYEEALPELNQTAVIAPKNSGTQLRLGETYLNLGQDDKAMAAFDKAVEISATPAVWNGIAYQLALKHVHLDVAQRYAESALSSTTAALRNISLDQPAPRDLRSSSSLGDYWDTLGWVEFAEDKPEPALKYLIAAWQLSQKSEVADHLGQVYAKQGDKTKAEYFYAMALNARDPDPETHGRLSALLGGNDKADAAVEKHRNELDRMRTIKLAGFQQETMGSADYFVLLDAGANSDAKVEGVKLITGDEKFKAASDTIGSVRYDQTFPDDTPVKILRRGTLTCPSAPNACTFQLALPEDVSSVE
jgi:Flp pilus assembly protein TadD